MKRKGIIMNIFLAMLFVLMTAASGYRKIVTPPQIKEVMFVRILFSNLLNMLVCIQYFLNFLWKLGNYPALILIHLFSILHHHSLRRLLHLHHI